MSRWPGKYVTSHRHSPLVKLARENVTSHLHSPLVKLTREIRYLPPPFTPGEADQGNTLPHTFISPLLYRLSPNICVEEEEEEEEEKEEEEEENPKAAEGR